MKNRSEDGFEIEFVTFCSSSSLITNNVLDFFSNIKHHRNIAGNIAGNIAAALFGNLFFLDLWELRRVKEANWTGLVYEFREFSERERDFWYISWFECCLSSNTIEPILGINSTEWHTALISLMPLGRVDIEQLSWAIFGRQSFCKGHTSSESMIEILCGRSHRPKFCWSIPATAWTADTADDSPSKFGDQRQSPSKFYMRIRWDKKFQYSVSITHLYT